MVAYEEAELSEALRRLLARGWAKEADGDRGRVVKYRHMLDEVFDLDSAELSLLAVLLLRGVQTAGELRERSERLYGFSSVRAVHESLSRLVDRGFVVRHARRSGQKEERYEQQLGSLEAAGLEENPGNRTPNGQVDEGREDPAGTGTDGEAEAEIGEKEEGPQEETSAEVGGEKDQEPDVSSEQAGSVRESGQSGTVDSRIDWLEAEVVKLRAQLTALLKELGE